MLRYQQQIWLYEIIGGTVRYRCVKIPPCGLIEHVLKDIAFYVQKHITHGTVVIISLLIRDKPLEAPAYVKRV